MRTYKSLQANGAAVTGWLMLLLACLFLPAVVFAGVEKNLHVEWEYDISLPGLAGYRIYQDGALVYTVNDPSQLSADFITTFDSDTAVFTMTAFDTDGNESPHSDPYTVTLPAAAPAPADGDMLSASFSASPLSGEAPLTVQFDASGSGGGSGTVVGWDWDFGDGVSASGAVVEHVYNSAGIYTVQLTVSDDLGNQASTSETITVTETTATGNLKPLATLAADPRSGEAPLTVQFDATGSRDEDGAVTDYQWSFGDGTTASGEIVSHTYVDAGIYTATVTVTDDEGATATASVSITVSPSSIGTTPPIPVLTTDVTAGTAPLTVSFDATGSTDPDGTIADYRWNFGDGATASGSFAQHTFPLEGTYTVRLTVTDDGGATEETAIQIVVVAPDAALPASETRQYSGGVTVNGEVIPGLVLEVRDSQGAPLALYPIENGAYVTDPLPVDPGYTFVARYGNQTKTVTPGQVVDWSLQFRSLTGSIRGVASSETVVVVAMSREAFLLQGVRLAGGTSVSYRFDKLLPASDWIVSAVVQNKPVLYYDGAYTEDAAKSVDLSVGDVTGIDFDFGIPAAATVSGMVSRDGTPTAQAPVYAYNVGTGALQMTVTDAGGSYSLALAEGDYILFAAVDGRTYYYTDQGPNQNYTRATPISVAAGKNVTGIDLAVTTCSYAISGRVTWADTGDGISGAQITARGERNLATAFSGSDGTYRIEAVCADDYTVFLLPTAKDYPVQARTVTVGPGREEGMASFSVGGGFTLSGTVTGADDGQPLADALLYLRSEPDGRLFGYRYFRTDVQGRYAIHDIPAGAYTLFIDHADYQKKVVAGLAIDRDAGRNFVLDRGGMIWGYVKDTSGQPVVGRLVVAQPQGQEPLFGRTDSQGKYGIGGLSSGVPLYVMVQRGDGNGYQIHPSTVTATQAGTQVDFTVSAVGQTFVLQGTVTQACDGSPLANARVVASYATAEEFFFRVAHTDANGRYTMSDLPALAGYRLVVEPDSGLRPVAVDNIDGSGGGTVTENISVPCGQGISGTVTAPNIPGPVYVVLFDAAENYVDHQVLRDPGADGDYTFSFDNLADGSYKLVVSAAGVQPVWYDNATDFAGATPITPGDPPLHISFGQ